MISPSDDPEVTHYGALDMQVCVPSNWTDDEVVDFANRENPSGTANGWGIRKEGDKALGGAHERVECSTRKGFVHIMLDC